MIRRPPRSTPFPTRRSSDLRVRRRPGASRRGGGRGRGHGYQRGARRVRRAFLKQVSACSACSALNPSPTPPPSRHIRRAHPRLCLSQRGGGRGRGHGYQRGARRVRRVFLTSFFFNDTATTEIYTFPYTTLFRSPRAPPARRVPARRRQRTRTRISTRGSPG